MDTTRRCAIVVFGALVANTIVTGGRFSSAAAPSAPAARVTVNARTPASDHIRLLAHDEPVRDVLLRLGDLAHLNVVVADDVRGNVNLSLPDATADEAVRAICGQLQLRCARDGRTLIVSMQSSVVVPLAVVQSRRAAQVIRSVFPRLAVRVEDGANALVLVGSQSDIQTARNIIQGIDVRDATKPATEGITLHAQQAHAVAQRLRVLYRSAKIEVLSPTTLLVSAAPPDLTQMKALIASIDTATPAPSAAPVSSEAVKVLQRPPQDVARAVKSQLPRLRTAVSGSVVTLTGPPDDVARAKSLVAQLDLPGFGERYTQVYRIKSLDASSVADLLRRSFHDLEVTVDTSLNAIAVTATATQQQRIADAIVQLDPPPNQQTATFGQGGAQGNGSTEVVTLKSFIPGQSQGGIDAVASFTQALQVVAPDVRVVQLPTPGQIALLGPPASVRSARAFIDKVDAVPALVVLDTEILEVDESVAKNLGLQLGTAAVSTTFSEVQPLANADGTPTRIGRFQALSRTPLSFTAQLNLLVQSGKGRVLADPRITTLSGRTASIRAGDTISILTTTAGNAGTIATTQVQSFQTGVTLDITPSVTPDGGVTVALHPVVNSLIGTNAGVPEISTRDTQTTVHLQDDETLVIGGLIQESDTRTTTKVPLLGDLPLLGRVFRNDSVQGQRNELIIVVTPHIVKPGKSVLPGPPLRALPTPPALPTLPPNARLPAPSGQLPAPSLVPATATPMPVASVAARAVETPAATPTAFAQTNVFTFGTAPQSNFAKPGDPVQIFYATLSPTVVANGTSVHVAVITTSNANAVKLQAGSQSIGLSLTAPGQWQATFPFPAAVAPPGQTNLTATLTASRPDGASASIPIPLNVPPRS
ncbi:MAG: hypothetical protein JWM87_1173 [Candidatus Eremiobacteraeota bacterium]|nr:hypothetical protein [Candidatus Eremiobacteraeota bacterium]